MATTTTMHQHYYRFTVEHGNDPYDHPKTTRSTKNGTSSSRSTYEYTLVPRNCNYYRYERCDIIASVHMDTWYEGKECQLYHVKPYKVIETPEGKVIFFYTRYRYNDRKDDVITDDDDDGNHDTIKGQGYAPFKNFLEAFQLVKL